MNFFLSSFFILLASTWNCCSAEQGGGQLTPLDISINTAKAATYVAIIDDLADLYVLSQDGQVKSEIGIMICRYVLSAWNLGGHHNEIVKFKNTFGIKLLISAEVWKHSGADDGVINSIENAVRTIAMRSDPRE